jgi:LmbE family N-acetylglucosaminyl deacetylase
MRILAVGCHPDDLEINAYGTLIRYIERGDEVDITAVIDKKLEALACHKSQIVWLKEHTGKDVLETTKATAIFRGKLSQVKYAEAFRRCDHVLRMTCGRMLP